MTYANQVHASDMITSLNGTDPYKQSFSDGLALFEQALDAWLPCFSPSQARTSGGAFGESDFLIDSEIYRTQFILLELRPAPLSSIVLMTFVLLLFHSL
jgi:hypothetical protein